MNEEEGDKSIESFADKIAEEIIKSNDNFMEVIKNIKFDHEKLKELTTAPERSEKSKQLNKFLDDRFSGELIYTGKGISAGKIVDGISVIYPALVSLFLYLYLDNFGSYRRAEVEEDIQKILEIIRGLLLMDERIHTKKG